MLNRPTLSRPPEKVFFMMTCPCDSFFNQAAQATVEVLEQLGIEVVIPENQTCSEQPAFHREDWKARRAVVRHMETVFAGTDPIILPSGSCAAMLFHGVPLEFEKERDLAAIKSMSHRTWEIFDFLYHGLRIHQWTGTLARKVAIHSFCHTRGTGTTQAIRALLGSIKDLDILDFASPEQCCEFGRAFSVSYPDVSCKMDCLKIDTVLEKKPDLLVSDDMGCLMHLQGLVEKEGKTLPICHAIEILRDTMRKESLKYVLAGH